MEASSEKMGVPLSFASSKGVELVVDWFAALAAGQLQNCYAHMEKRGSRYLRYALFNAAKYVCLWCPTFSAYLEKKRSEGKHYNVAISHAAKKLVRLIFAMQRSGKAFLADY